MLNLVLLAGKAAFLFVLYWFVFLVIRSSTRELRALAETRAPVGRIGGEAGKTPAAGRGAPAATGPHKQTARAWALVVVESPYADPGWAYVLPVGGQAVVGRSGDADLHLPDTFVSSHHARLWAEPEGLVVEDLGSTNGTFVNGDEIGMSTLVGAGDEVAVGDTIFRVEDR